MISSVEEFLGFYLYLNLKKIQPKPGKFSSNFFVKFCGEKVFKFILNSKINDKNQLLLLTTNLNKLGIRAVDPHTFNRDYVDGIEDSYTLQPQASSDDGTYELFKADLILQDIPSLTCCILIESTSLSYQLHQRDFLLSRQLEPSAMNQAFTDFELISDGKFYKVHKFLLCARSPEFATLLEDGKQQLKIPRFEAACMEQFLFFLYTGELDGPVRSPQLRKLANKYKIHTLLELCLIASRDIVKQEIANIDCLREIAEKPSKEIKLESEAEIDFLSTALHLKITWEIDLGECTKEHLTTNVKKMSSSFTYQDKQFFQAEILVRHEDQHTREFKMTFHSFHHLRIGCKVARVIHCNDWDEIVCPMDEETVLNDPLLQTFTGSQWVLYTERPTNVIFYVQLESVVTNFGHKLVDSTWKEQLWASAVDQQFTDINFMIEGNSFSAHRALLAARSPVFATLFSGLPEGSHIGELCLDGVDSTTFRDFLRFIYTGELDQSADKEELLSLAEKYQVATLVALCNQQSFYENRCWSSH